MYRQVLAPLMVILATLLARAEEPNGRYPQGPRGDHSTALFRGKEVTVAQNSSAVPQVTTALTYQTGFLEGRQAALNEIRLGLAQQIPKIDTARDTREIIDSVAKYVLSQQGEIARLKEQVKRLERSHSVPPARGR